MDKLIKVIKTSDYMCAWDGVLQHSTGMSSGGETALALEWIYLDHAKTAK